MDARRESIATFFDLISGESNNPRRTVLRGVLSQKQRGERSPNDEPRVFRSFRSHYPFVAVLQRPLEILRQIA